MTGIHIRHEILRIRFYYEIKFYEIILRSARHCVYNHRQTNKKKLLKDDFSC